MPETRRPLVIGNWKMHCAPGEARRLAGEIADRFDPAGVDAGIAPPFVAIPAAAEALGGGPIRLGAQDVHFESEGPFTGAVSASMLAAAGCSFVLVGHSERRTLFGETDGDVERKTRAALAAGLTPVVCVGENATERDRGEAEAVVARQLGALRSLADRRREIVIAYEPVWAIGSGKTATPEIAQGMHAAIRSRLAEIAGDAAAAMRLLYGGSVKGDNARSMTRGVDVDGVLVGGASLRADSFLAIVSEVRESFSTGTNP